MMFHAKVVVIYQFGSAADEKVQLFENLSYINT